jgi:KaiC/GvpD/RAD55 family RecA-like ATPase
MAHVVGKEQCWKCAKEGRDRSQNNAAVYSDGGIYCWSGHGLLKPGTESQFYKKEEEAYVEIMGSIFNEEVHEELKAVTGVDPAGFRGLTRETCAYFGVRHEYDATTGEVTRQVYPTTINYEISGYKSRHIPKDFSKPIGITGRDCELFGQFRFKNSVGKYALLVAGEIDQLSGFQMLRNYQKQRGNDAYEAIPVVSATCGETGGINQVQKQYEWFDRFERIIVCYDADPAGEEATQKLLKVLPKGKVYIMRLPAGDSNKYLVNGKEKEWVAAFFNARKFVPEGVTSSLDLEDKMLEYLSTPRLSLPPFMHKLQNMLCGGFPYDSIVNILSASGTGKSTITDALILHWITNENVTVGIVSLEASEGEYAVNLSSQYLKFKINLLETPEERIEFISRPENIERRKQLWQKENGDPRFYLVDADIDNLKAKVEYLVRGLGCKVIVLDPLQDIFDALPEDEQAKFMKWQKDLRKSEGIIFININHSRKSSKGQKANSAGAELHEEDMHGHSSIFKSGSINLIATRDKENADPMIRNTTKLKLTKARGIGNTGNAGELLYVNEEHQLYDKDDYMLTMQVEF